MQIFYKGKKLRFFLIISNFFSFFFPKKFQNPKNYQKIIVSNLGAIGDLVILLKILPIIKEKNPNSYLAIITREKFSFIKNLSFIDKHYVYKHFYFMEGKKNIKNIFFSFKANRKTKNEILLEKFDLAIDFSHFFSNSIFFFKSLKIPIIAGYPTGGFRHFLNVFQELESPLSFIGNYHVALLEKVGFFNKFSLKTPKFQLSNKSKKKLKKYVVFHPFSSQEFKNWENPKWQQLLEKFEDFQYLVVFTSSGRNEKEKIDEIIGSRKNVVNLTNSLDLEEFISVIKFASLVITIDTSALHIANYYNIPTIGIFSNIHPIRFWTNKGKNFEILTFPTECKNCFYKKPCYHRKCITNIEPEIVFQKALKFLN